MASAPESPGAPVMPTLPPQAAQQARDALASVPQMGGGIAAMAQPQMPQLPSQANDMARQRLSAIFGGDRMGRPSFAQTQAPQASRPAGDSPFGAGRMPQMPQLPSQASDMASPGGKGSQPGGMSVPQFAEGGEVPGIDVNDPVVKKAMAAIAANDTQSPEAIKSVTDFTRKYGKGALMRLVEMMRSPTRQVQGPSTSGMGDEVPAMIDGMQRADMTSGEMVVSNPDLSALGDGDREIGAERLGDVIETARMEHYGRKKHPEKVDMNKVMRKATA